MTPEQIRAFILAGNALFTLKSMRTGKHFTFKVQLRYQRNPQTGQLAPVEPQTWTVKVLAGRDNGDSRNYRYCGSIREGHFSYLLSQATPAVKGFAWCWKHLERCGERFEFAHAGRCGRCGRLLTVPESIASGIGPECRDKLAFEAMGGADGLLNQLFGG